MNTKNKSLMYTNLLTISIFGIVILVIMYFLQVIFLDVSYENFRVSQVKSIANKISNKLPKNLDSYLNDISYSEDVCIEYIDGNATSYYNENIKGCILKYSNNKILSLMESMYNSRDDTVFYRINNPLYETKTLLYGIRLNQDKYIFINSQLEDLSSASGMLQKQLVYLSLIVLALAIILAYFVSNLITKPIIDITSRARRMGNGDLNVDFLPSNISEINDLSNTLNYMKNEMIKTDDYRRDLMANVSHDLKTPLTLIKSYAELVRDLTYKDDKKREDNLNVIINETDRLNGLVNDILVLSKIEAKKEEIIIEKYDLVKEIKNIISKFEILEITDDYKFIYDGPENLIVKADKNKINQVIYNLIGNAINYTGDDMKIYINVSTIKQGYKVEIIDTGKGIEKEKINYIWDRYYKTDKKHKRNKIGTGLGLSIVKEILIKHGFEYGVKSTIGKGTNFFFIIKK